MKSIIMLAVAVVTLAVVLTASAAMAITPNFTLTSSQSGGNWIYTVHNNTPYNHNSTDEYLVGWNLYWVDPIEGMGLGSNNAIATANFNADSTGYIGKPATWSIDNSYTSPSWVITNDQVITTGIGPGQTGDFTVHFKGSTLPVKAQFVWFDSNQNAGYVYPVVPNVPEPASVLSLICGFAGCIGFVRFRKH